MRKLSLTLALAWLVAGVLSAGARAQTQANPSHVHMGHVMTSFMNTPDKQGLLPVARAEAATAAQHAALAAKSPTDLNAMKLHAGHVLHAIDPSVEANGPGLGYGVKRAAQGVAQHIELAAKAEGASQNVKTHAVHVAAAANSTVQRADQIIAIAQKIRAASTAAEAAPLAAQMSTLCQQLTTGADVNGDGRVNWDAPEGGLDQALQHMQLMEKGEGGL
ncbi:MAG: hypothetical protein R2752_01470 [Vicinamibacterales bacterium]